MPYRGGLIHSENASAIGRELLRKAGVAISEADYHRIVEAGAEHLIDVAIEALCKSGQIIQLTHDQEIWYGAADTARGMVMQIDRKFQTLIPPLRTEERANLEASLKAEGCRDRLVTWNGILLDGHNRYEICSTNNIPFETLALEFESRDDARDWILENQLGRRNLSESAFAYFLGKTYERRKRQGARNDLTCGQGDQKLKTTAELLAAEKGVSEKTVRRAAEFARNVDKIAETHPEVIVLVLSEKSKISRDEVRKVATLSEIRRTKVLANPDKVATALSHLRRQDRSEAIIADAAPSLASKKKYAVIYADPPWRYEHTVSTGTEIENKYPTMALENICALKLPAAKNAMLFLWATAPKVCEAMQVSRHGVLPIAHAQSGTRKESAWVIISAASMSYC
jgi:hypothetical protein